MAAYREVSRLLSLRSGTSRTFLGRQLKTNVRSRAAIDAQELGDESGPGAADLHGGSVEAFIHAYRTLGHHRADVFPFAFGTEDGTYSPFPFNYRSFATEIDRALSPDAYGLSNHESVNSIFRNCETVADLHSFLRSVYCGAIAIEFDHVETEAERTWLTSEFEESAFKQPPQALKELVRLMIKSEAFDHFLSKRYPTVKRYGGEGAEAMLAFFYETLRAAPIEGVEEIVIGMAHRGRLSILQSLLGFSATEIFHKIDGKPEFPPSVSGLGDVLSHLSISKDVSMDDDKSVRVAFLPNPSHLEAVNPVVLGRCRAREQSSHKGEYSGDLPGAAVLPVLVHGDASVAGQGVVFECLSMSTVPHYRVGGTLHLVVNNQIGYTNPGGSSRSSQYASDVAKAGSAPVIHVNGSRPDLLLRATDLALRYRQRFRRDVFIDLVCYRRHGHNELDEPRFTQPNMYAAIDSLPQTPPDQFASQLIEDGVLTVEERDNWRREAHEELKIAKEAVSSFQPQARHLQAQWSHIQQAPTGPPQQWDTGVDLELLKFVGAQSVAVPDDFQVHPTISRTHIARRLKKLQEGNGLDWSTAEALGMGSLLAQGYDVRISGQDVGRGTFSQRHAALTHQTDESRYIPLNNISPDQKSYFEVANSILSEEAVMGFEYGMSIESPNRLCIWEAQFGDFFNGAQIMIDTLVAGGEAKWLLQSGLVLLLPHGFDGAGPEHSSARIERFLQLTDSREAQIDSANVNMEVVFPTTPAQYFHLLRRQIVRPYRKPLVVIGPKMLLRHPSAVSSLASMAPGTSFEPVLDDDSVANAAAVDRIVFCSGKHYYTLSEHAKTQSLRDTALVRLESLCPFPVRELQTVVARYSNATKFVYSQEEPRNMGAWSFIAPRFRNLLQRELRYAGRPELAIPGVAIGQWHKEQAAQVLKDTFT